MNKSAELEELGGSHLQEEAFRVWLKGRGVSANSINTRTYAVRTIEKNLSKLGWAGGDLDQLVATREVDALRDKIKEIREDSKRGGEAFRDLLPQSDKPEGRLTSWIAWLGQYEQFVRGASSKMPIDFQTQYTLWDEFLEAWPIERLQSMSLEEYTLAGSKDTLTYWLEAKLSDMGSIWGGSAFKFGIFSRANTEPKPSNETYAYDDDFGWHSELGATAAEAFESVRNAVVEIYHAARASDLRKIDAQKAVWQVVGWKLAFHYQNRDRPTIINIFKRDWLASYLNLDEKKSTRPELYEALIQEKPDDEGILEFGHRIWSEIMKDQDSNESPESGGASKQAIVKRSASNKILFGPPGTGKTFQTAAQAVLLCDGYVPADRDELKDRYDALMDAGQIAFVTFHQSYSYEDFVEGLRPETDNPAAAEEQTPASGGFRLEPRDGVFREVCALAEQARKSSKQGKSIDLAGRNFFKVSLGRAGEDEFIYDAAIEGGYIVLGYGGEVDWSDPKFEDYQEIFDRWNEIEPETSGNSGNIAQVYCLRGWMKKGDIVIASEGNLKFRAIGEIVGPYEYNPTGIRTYNHRRAVKWHVVLDEALPVETILEGKFSQVSFYNLKTPKLKIEALSRLLAGTAEEQGHSREPDQFVLIIDEINRANVSKVFGELITLLEPDKRLGGNNALRVKLPYSGDTFGVPENLHIVGTMNTADRSIALLDTALRRRFQFTELMPQPELLKEDVDGLNLQQVLQTLNDRIEYLFDRDHQIGHAYFMECETLEDVDLVMRNKVIPLLAEYFYEDWDKVRQVLGETQDDGAFVVRRKLVPPPSSNEDYAEDRFRFVVREEFGAPAYQQLML